MCQKRNSVKGLVIVNDKPKWIRVDACIRHLPNSLSMSGYRTVGCCCGHGKYSLTMICQVGNKNRFFDLISGVDVKKKQGGGWYVKDKEGFYYIPEVNNDRRI